MGIRRPYKLVSRQSPACANMETLSKMRVSRRVVPDGGKTSKTTGALGNKWEKGHGTEIKGTSPDPASRLLLNPHLQCNLLLYSLQIWSFTSLVVSLDQGFSTLATH